MLKNALWAVSSMRRFLLIVLIAALSGIANAADLAEIKQSGVLRHLGIPYANFVTGSGDGLDVEVIKRFAAHIGVRYEFVETDWKHVISDLTGNQFRVVDGNVEIVGDAPIKGDLIANGLTVLPWRQQLVDYSEPTFPSGVWLVARADSAMSPIAESGDELRDVQLVKAALRGRPVLTMENTCLDPDLYQLDQTGAEILYYTQSTNLNEMVPAILRRDAETTLLDVPDALIALEKWPGEIKIIGPVSAPQRMGVAFRQDAPELRAAFNAFLRQLKADGTYNEMVRHYYPSVFVYFGEFFSI